MPNEIHEFAGVRHSGDAAQPECSRGAFRVQSSLGHAGPNDSRGVSWDESNTRELGIASSPSAGPSPRENPYYTAKDRHMDNVAQDHYEGMAL